MGDNYGAYGGVLFQNLKENQKGLRLKRLQAYTVFDMHPRSWRLSCARSRAYRPLSAAQTHTAVCRERLTFSEFCSIPHASRSGCSMDNPIIATSATSRAQGVRVRTRQEESLQATRPDAQHRARRVASHWGASDKSVPFPAGAKETRHCSSNKRSKNCSFWFSFRF